VKNKELRFAQMQRDVGFERPRPSYDLGTSTFLLALVLVVAEGVVGSMFLPGASPFAAHEERGVDTAYTVEGRNVHHQPDRLDHVLLDPDNSAGKNQGESERGWAGHQSAATSRSW
jgi:hypothetical protein